MTTNQEIYRKSLLSRIHQIPFVLQAKAVGGWEDWLKERYGVTSSAKLSIEELNNLLNILNGKESEAKTSGSRPRDESKISDKQIAKIKQLYGGEVDSGLLEFCAKTVKKRPLRLEVLTKSEATKVITGLEYLKQIKKRS
ncbi:MAG: DUF1018 domain-containing protein [Campylobacterales bacterium]|nr:DUF1018 domain-containing protein [Campylobacterales bacterium]